MAPSDVEQKFRALEGSDVDDDLAKMKAALGGGSKVAGEVGGRAGWAAAARSWARCWHAPAAADGVPPELGD